jgi:hypothetical protein
MHNGKAVICQTAPKEDLERVLGPLTDDAYEAHVMERSVPDDAKDIIFLIDDMAIPLSREFRDAWAIRDGRIETDMPKARDIHRDRLRREREPLLQKLDVDEMRAGEIADEAGQASAIREAQSQKQSLRDVTGHPKIEAASTPEELFALTLSKLVAT